MPGVNGELSAGQKRDGFLGVVGVRDDVGNGLCAVVLDDVVALLFGGGTGRFAVGPNPTSLAAGCRVGGLGISVLGPAVGGGVTCRV